MQHREHDDVLLRRPKVDGIWKCVQQRPAHIVDHRWKLEWPLTDTHEGMTDVAEKSLGETGSFVLVPSRGILEIGLGEWPNDEPAGHSNQWWLSSFLRSRC